MGNNVAFLFYSQPYRLHHAAAFCLPVAGIIIDVLGPEAMRTMIRKTITNYFCMAMFAIKILYSSLKLL